MAEALPQMPSRVDEASIEPADRRLAGVKLTGLVRITGWPGSEVRVG
jgi:hypothetical protein